MIKEISGKKYRLPDLDIFQEFALASTISPVLTMMSMSTDRAKLEAKFPQSFTALMGNMGMDRRAKDEILKTFLTGVTRDENSAFLPVLSPTGELMYADMNLTIVLRIGWEILVKHKLIDFFTESLSSSKEKPGAKPVSSGSAAQTTGL